METERSDHGDKVMIILERSDDGNRAERRWKQSGAMMETEWSGDGNRAER